MKSQLKPLSTIPNKVTEMCLMEKVTGCSTDQDSENINWYNVKNAMHGIIVLVLESRYYTFRGKTTSTAAKKMRMQAIELMCVCAFILYTHFNSCTYVIVL